MLAAAKLLLKRINKNKRVVDFYKKNNKKRLLHNMI